jgi:hypothetical protein
VVPYRHETDDPKENHDKTSLIINSVTKQDKDQPMNSPGPCSEILVSSSGVAASGT